MQTEEKKSIFDKLEAADVRYIYLLVLIAISVPILKPFGLPMGPISGETMGLYNFIDKLPPRSVVCIIADQSPAAAAEVQSGQDAILRHLVAKGLRVLFYAPRTDALPFIDKSMVAVIGAASDHKDYGKLYANVGFIPEYEVGLTGLAGNLFFTGKDAYGKDLKTMEFFQDLPTKTAKDWSLAIYFGASSVDWVIRQVTDPYGPPTGGGVAAVLVSRMYPYYPHKLIGFLSGLKGSAEYEILVRVPGEAAAGMDAQSFGHMAIIIMIILGNIGYAVKRSRRTK